MAIRSVRLGDAAQLARLLDRLGYPQSPDVLRGRLEQVLADARAEVLVADDGEALIGAASYFFVPVAHDSRPWCHLIEQQP